MSFRHSETVLDDDPCIKEFRMSRQCLGDNSREQCQDFLQNYEHCRYFWSWIQTMRANEGIKPAMPIPEERDEVKEKYLPLLRPPMS